MFLSLVNAINWNSEHLKYPVVKRLGCTRNAMWRFEGKLHLSCQPVHVGIFQSIIFLAEITAKFLKHPSKPPMSMYSNFLTLKSTGLQNYMWFSQ